MASTREHVAVRRPSRVPGALRRWRTPLLVYLATRAVVLAAFYLAAGSTSAGLVIALNLWDGVWYGRVIDGGYAETASSTEASNLAFFPLFPVGVRAVRVLTPLDSPQSAVVLNLVVGAVFAVVAWELARRLFDEVTADRSSVLVLCFPGAFVMSMAYSEALALTFVAGCLLALLKERWVLAGLLGALAGATRPNAAAVALACAVAALLALRRHRGAGPLAAPVLAPVGLLAFLAFLWAWTGEPRAWLYAQTAWGEGFDFGRTGLARLRFALDAPLLDANISGAALGGLIAVAALAWMWWRRPLPLAHMVYVTAVLVLVLGGQAVGARPRFLLMAFPLLLAIAHRTRPWVLYPLCAGLLGVQVLLAVVTTRTLYLTP